MCAHARCAECREHMMYYVFYKILEFPLGAAALAGDAFTHKHEVEV